MPLRHIGEASPDYYLVLFDRDGNERPELDGSMLSARLKEAVQDGVTDVFISSHGWKGDIPAAIRQYDSWVATMAGLQADRDRARLLDPEFKAAIIGVHWPSLPWGDEDAGDALLSDDTVDEPAAGEPAADEFAAEQHMATDELVELYARRIADTDAAKAALATILDAADDQEAADQVENGQLPPHLEEAYQTLFDEAGLGLDGAAAAPGSDQSVFRPLLIMNEWSSATSEQAQPAAGQPGLLDGGRPGLKDVLLMPVRQLSFWAMKHRARHVGETGVHTLLGELQKAAPSARFHLMGHSFGCIVVSAAVSGPLGEGTVTSRLPRPIQSLFLVQGAMSLWSYAESIPYPPSVPGYFRPVEVTPRLVSGPIVTTRSTFDRAVGTFFPLGAKVGDDRLLDEELPEFGGVGAFGIQGTPTDRTHDLLVLGSAADYGFDAGHVYNIDASTVICHGGGASGAHSDISHPEIAHVFWQAALVGAASA
jgi:hypothetical protein